MTSMKWTGQSLGGNYQLVEQLATDDFAATYRAYDNNIRDEVAVKIIHPNLTQSAGFPAHFANTARAIAQLRHPNLNRLLDYAHDQGAYFLITEWVPGTTLRARLDALRERRSVMSIDEIVRRATDLTEALSYAHANGQLHLTIKPGSIMLANNNRTVLLDLGLSAMAGGSRQLAQHSSLLTAAYLAPEQLRGEIADARTDLFALGVSLYEMLTGQIPFGTDITQTLARQTGRPLPDIRQRRPNTPAPLAALVTRLLQPDRTARVQTAAELGQLLGGLRGAPDAATIVEKPASAATMIQDDGATMVLADEGATMLQADDQATKLQPDSGATMIQPDDGATIVDPAARHDPTMVQPASDPGRTVVEEYQATTIEPAGPGQRHEPTVVDNALPTEVLGASIPPTTIDPPTWSHEPVPGRGQSQPQGTVISPSPEPPAAPAKSRNRTPVLIGCAVLLLVALCAGSLYAVFGTSLGDSILGRETATPEELVAATTTPTATAEGAEADETAAPTEPTDEVAPTEAVAPTEGAEEPTATTAAATEAPTATTAPPTATLEPTPTTAPPTATTVPPTPTQAGPSVQITAIRLDGSTYIVDYTTVGYTESLPGMHIHFFFNTVSPDQAGVPGSGPWYLWGGPRPFNGYTTADRPGAATQMCALVANPDHSVIQGTGNCVNLP
ncbi:MAG: serine/threonine protein kinase [Anaerolineales bacterium]|nr:serine/threonine protein kinase [Anaerolineales bacterium]